MRVLNVMTTVFGVQDAKVLAASVLHDTIEDTNSDFDDLERHFGQRVAQYVALLSKDKRLPEDERERAYVATLAEAPVEVKLCKFGDTYDNLVDAESLSPEARRKTVRRARELMQLLGASLPQAWKRVLPLVQQRIDAVASGIE